MPSSDSWKIASAFASLHERRKEIRISAIMIKQSSAKAANELARRVEIKDVELGRILSGSRSLTARYLEQLRRSNPQGHRRDPWRSHEK
jgi:hypothetical protein